MAFGPVFSAKKKLQNHQLINQDSGDFEYYTPPEYTSAAAAMFRWKIDLDPASSERANRLVGAENIFTIEDDGLKQKWFGNVWMNHPFSKGEKACHIDRKKCKKARCKKRGYHIDQDIPGNSDWVNKLISEYESGNVNEAVMICFLSASESWFRPLLEFPICFINGRVDYLDKNYERTRGAPKGSVIIYLGRNEARFRQYFERLGKVKI